MEGLCNIFQEARIKQKVLNWNWKHSISISFIFVLTGNSIVRYEYLYSKRCLFAKVWTNCMKLERGFMFPTISRSYFRSAFLKFDWQISCLIFGTWSTRHDDLSESSWAWKGVGTPARMSHILMIACYSLVGGERRSCCLIGFRDIVVTGYSTLVYTLLLKDIAGAYVQGCKKQIEKCRKSEQP